MNRVIIKTGKEKGLSYELKPGVNRLGRDAGNDLVLEDATISGTHCELEVLPEGLAVRDLGSTNGTFIRGQRISGATVPPGQSFKVGDVELAFDNAPVVVAIPDYDFAEAGPPPPLPDGSIACLNHAQVAAVYTCVQCNRCFCAPCVHRLKMAGGPSSLFCPACSGRCELLPHLRAGQQKKSWLARVVDMLKS